MIRIEEYRGLDFSHNRGPWLRFDAKMDEHPNAKCKESPFPFKTTDILPEIVLSIVDFVFSSHEACFPRVIIAMLLK
jgi:hypothetical protein